MEKKLREYKERYGSEEPTEEASEEAAEVHTTKPAEIQVEKAAEVPTEVAAKEVSEESPIAAMPEAVAIPPEVQKKGTKAVTDTIQVMVKGIVEAYQTKEFTDLAEKAANEDLVVQGTKIGRASCRERV